MDDLQARESRKRRGSGRAEISINLPTGDVFFMLAFLTDLEEETLEQDIVFLDRISFLSIIQAGSSGCAFYLLHG